MSKEIDNLGLSGCFLLVLGSPERGDKKLKDPHKFKFHNTNNKNIISRVSRTQKQNGVDRLRFFVVLINIIETHIKHEHCRSLHFARGDTINFAECLKQGAVGLMLACTLSSGHKYIYA